MALEKLLNFTTDVGDLADKPNGTMSAAEVKAQFDAAPNELRLSFNQLIDDLGAVVDGDSGADNVAVTAIAGLTGATVQAVLESLKALDDTNKTYLLEQIQGVVLGQISDGSITDVKLSDAGIKQAFATHKAERATLTTLGHVKAETDAEGNLILPELSASNVTTTQGPTVQTTLDTLKSDTDNKVISVRDAVISKGGTVTQVGEVPTASELVAGVGSLSTVHDAVVRTDRPLITLTTNDPISPMGFNARFIARKTNGDLLFIVSNVIYLVSKDTQTVITSNTVGDIIMFTHYESETDTVLLGYKVSSDSYMKRANALTFANVGNILSLGTGVAVGQSVVLDSEVWIMQSNTTFVNRYNKTDLTLLSSITLPLQSQYPKLYNNKVYIGNTNKQLYEYNLDGTLNRTIGTTSFYLYSHTHGSLHFDNDFVYETVPNTQIVRKLSLITGEKIYDYTNPSNISASYILKNRLWITTISSIFIIDFGGFQETAQTFSGVMNETAFVDELTKTLNASIVRTGYYVLGSIVEK